MVFRNSNVTSCNNPNCDCHKPASTVKATNKKDDRALALKLYGWIVNELRKHEAAKPKFTFDPEAHRKEQAEFDARIEAMREEYEREDRGTPPPPPDCYARIRPDWTRRTPIVIDDVPLPPSTAELFQKEKKV